jgi:transcriptional regulator GlxA family with amidase domain
VLEAPRLWSVKRWAHVAGVSPRQLVRQCRAAGFVAVPKDILLAARLASACALLRSGHTLSLPELARACGWVDVRSFRGALRRAGFSSPAALAQLTTTQGTLGALLERLSTRRA